MLNAKQRHLLQKIKRSKKYYYTENESSMISYLRSQKYVSTSSEGGDRWGNNSISFCTITEFGKAYLSNTRNQKLEIWIPHIVTFAISLIALLISFVSLSTIAPEIWKNIEKFLSSL